MRLFEVDLGSVRDVMAVMQGLANKQGQSSELPWPVVQNILKPFNLGISTPDALIALKNSVDPQGDVIQDITDDGTIILNTKVKDPNADQGDTATPKAGKGGPSLDSMASHAAKEVTK
jgi:hypothetical protein